MFVSPSEADSIGSMLVFFITVKIFVDNRLAYEAGARITFAAFPGYFNYTCSLYLAFYTVPVHRHALHLRMMRFVPMPSLPYRDDRRMDPWGYRESYSPLVFNNNIGMDTVDVHVLDGWRSDDSPDESESDF